MIAPFWTNEPTILLNNYYITEIWPTSDMTHERKMNAITRFVLLLTILGFFMTKCYSIIWIAVITLFVIVFVHKNRKLNILQEGYTGVSLADKPSIKIQSPEQLQEIIQSEFEPGTKKNPFSNVLLTDIMDNPDKKSAPPSFNPDSEEKITKDIKRSVQMMNPTIDNTNKQLYGDLWENFELDQSNRLFYSTANTKVVNDQGAFAEFLYGNMPSGKSSGPDGDFQRVANSYRYILY
jgi:hypothetical protein